MTDRHAVPSRRRPTRTAAAPLRRLPDEARALLAAHERQRAAAWSRLRDVATDEALTLRETLVTLDDELATAVFAFRRGDVTLVSLVSSLGATRARLEAIVAGATAGGQP